MAVPSEIQSHIVIYTFIDCMLCIMPAEYKEEDYKLPASRSSPQKGRQADKQVRVTQYEKAISGYTCTKEGHTFNSKEQGGGASEIPPLK